MLYDLGAMTWTNGRRRPAVCADGDLHQTPGAVTGNHAAEKTALPCVSKTEKLSHVI
jgi:hypothetical protein